MNEKDDDAKYRAPALDKGLDILELLSQQPHGMTRAEIVKAMGRGPSEIYRMLERLVRRHYISRSIGGTHYQLTMKLFVLGSQHPPVSRLVSQALPLMDKFAHTTQQSVHLVVPDCGVAVVVAQASNPDNWAFAVHIGARLDLCGTGSGRTLLAFQTTERRTELLAYVKSDAETDKNAKTEKRWREIEKDINTTRDTGYRIENSIQMADIIDISVPVMSPQLNAIAVLTCPYIRHLDRCDGADTQSTLDNLEAMAKQISLD